MKHDIFQNLLHLSTFSNPLTVPAAMYEAVEFREQLRAPFTRCPHCSSAAHPATPSSATTRSGTEPMAFKGLCVASDFRPWAR